MVRAGANLSWTARCPSHDDRNPSLSIRALCDGRILMHCHAGCPVEAVVAAVGLSLSDLMPPRSRDTSDGPGGHATVRQPWRIDQLTEAARHDALVVLITLAQVATDALLDVEDIDMALAAAHRLSDALGGP